MKIDERKVISKIALLATEILDAMRELSDEELNTFIASNTKQILTICGLIEFESQPTAIPTTKEFYSKRNNGFFETPQEVTSMFQEALREQRDKPVIPPGPSLIHE